jgi:Xaa-Pro aminopeptidase
MTIDQKIETLRELMSQQRLDAYIVPSGDPHQSEYVAAHWQERQWLSGFTGSAGTLVVTATHAGLWTDSRYFLQAEDELKDTCVQLHRLNVPHTPEHTAWLADNLDEGSAIGFDGACFSVSQVRAMQRSFRKKAFSLHYEHDLVSEMWRDRPALPEDPIFEHDVSFAGKARADKLQEVRKAMAALGVDYHFVATLDDIAWLFNLRGQDVPCNPVAIAYAVIGTKKAYLFANHLKFNQNFIKILNNENILINDYEEIKYFLQALPEEQRVLLDPATTNVKLYDALNKQGNIVEGDTISTALKAVKNKVEIDHLKRTMAKDGAALAKLFHWLEEEVKARAVPETEVAERLAGFRAEQANYRGESFDAIVGYEANGAIVHYHAKPETCAHIADKGLLLLDSGGQYLDGTTDITRTVCFGKSSKEQMRHYTLVLKGHISVARLKFPVGTRGNQIDLLARMHLWQEGLNYGHGTGHGVGFFLNVHEGPQSISSGLTAKGNTPIVAGMLTSNEPGFYKTGSYGIRIENLVLAVEAETTEYGQFLCFDTLSLYPIDTHLVDYALLTQEECKWLADYNARAVSAITPLLEQGHRAWFLSKYAVNAEGAAFC